MKTKTMVMLAMTAVSSVRAQDAAETVQELDLSSDTTINVPAGSVKKIEYVSGSGEAKLVKEGAGTLEVAIVGNTNAAFFVNGGTLKFVRPGKLELESDVWFHLDPTDAGTMDVTSENGTNFVTSISSASPTDGSPTAGKLDSRPYPFLVDDALNGLPVVDFGTLHNSKRPGYGAALDMSEKTLVNEMLYVWCDEAGIENADVGEGSTILGPNPVNWRYSYRGYGGNGAGYPLYHTAHSQVTANLHVDEVKRGKDFIPESGWHLLRAHSSTPMTSPVQDYGFYGFGASPVYAVSYGGFRLAEAIVCTNVLTDAEREKAVFYLKRKWFGGYPVKKVILAEGTTLDTSEAPVSITYFQTFGSASVTGEQNLRLSHPSGVSTNLQVSGVFESSGNTVIPNLGFSGDGEVSVTSGLSALNVAEGEGLFVKSGDGNLNVADIGDGFTSLSVTAGTLTVSPLLSPAASLHVDASDAGAFVLENVDGTNFVDRWEDVNRNGQALVKTSQKYRYDEDRTVNRPFLRPDALNGLPVVDFGTQADSEHQDCWGAMLDVRYPISRNQGEHVTTEQQGVYQVFSVWEDDPASIARPPLTVEENGVTVTKPVIGPVLYGNGYSWYRGAGGNGTGFPFCSISGPSTVRENMYLDNVRFYSQYVRFTPIDPGAHLMDQKIGYSENESSSLTRVGGNQDCMTTNGPYATRGVYGGVRFAEIMAFRHYLTDRQRVRIRNALGVKWFGTEKYSYGYDFNDVSVSQEASLSLPYAEVTVTNLTVGGVFSVRSVAVCETLSVVGDSEIRSPLSVAAGADVSFARKDDGGFFKVEADALSIGSKGRIVISDWEGILCGQSYRVIGTDSLTGDGSGWRGRKPDGTIRAGFEVRSDGLYLTFESGGTRIIIR